MKLKVLKEFKDKNNGRLYRKGDVVDFSEARAKELLADVRKLVVAEKPAQKRASAKKKD